MRLDKEVTDQFLNVEVRDSIDLIEKTLAEPHLYSLPHLIMWRNTAQEKIQKIKNFPLPIPQKIVTEKIEKYESLIKQLRAEILTFHESGINLFDERRIYILCASWNGGGYETS